MAVTVVVVFCMRDRRSRWSFALPLEVNGTRDRSADELYVATKLLVAIVGPATSSLSFKTSLTLTLRFIVAKVIMVLMSVVEKDLG